MTARIRVKQGDYTLQDTEYEGEISITVEGDCTVKTPQGAEVKPAARKSARKTARTKGR